MGAEEWLAVGVIAAGVLVVALIVLARQWMDRKEVKDRKTAQR